MSENSTRSLVDRRTGGLENVKAVFEMLQRVDRRTGGLEILGKTRGRRSKVDRRTGGLENILARLSSIILR